MLDILNKINYPTTKFDDGLVINADCLEVLKQLPDESIDIILTDPPYNIGYAEWDLFFNIPEVTAEWYRVLKPNDSIFCFAGWSFVC